MKKYNILKTIQMILFILFALGCGYMIFSRYELYHAIANDPAVKAVCAMLWACLGLCFVFILVDFGFIGAYKKATGSWTLLSIPIPFPALPTGTAATG